MPTATTLKSIAWTLGTLAVLYRIGVAEDLIEGRSKFLGIF